MYRALMRFADLQDGGRIYDAGDSFPREGLTVSDERLHELLGSDNRARKPLIVAIPEENGNDAKQTEDEVEQTEDANTTEAQTEEAPVEPPAEPAPAEKKKRSRSRKKVSEDA